MAINHSLLQISGSVLNMRAQGSQSSDLEAEIRPYSQCQKVCFFPQFRTKKFQFAPPPPPPKKNIFFVVSPFHIIQIQNILLHIYSTEVVQSEQQVIYRLMPGGWGGREAQANMEETDREILQWVEAHNGWPSRKEHLEIRCEICYTCS